VADDLLDLALLLKLGERTTGKRTVDLQSVDKGGDGDEAVRLNLLLETVRGGLVEDDGVLGLVLDCVCIMSAKLFLRAAPWRGVRHVRIRGLGMESVPLRDATDYGDGRFVISRIVWDVYGVRMDWMEEACVPLPLDHFFFCFLAPVAAGAFTRSVSVCRDSTCRLRGAVPFCRM
jgi:hypothetical protein